jgi:hypothetical protein
LHLVFSSSGRLMRILRSIVAPSTAFTRRRTGRGAFDC